MDCGLARERLDVLHPDRPEKADSEVADAVAHVQECAACAEDVQARQAFDREVGRVLRDVPVPTGLRERLVLALTATMAEPPKPAVQLRAELPRRRRWWMTAAVTTAAGLLVAVVVWMLFSRGEPPLLALDEVRTWSRDHLRTTADIDALPALGEELSPVLADGRWGAAVGQTVPRGADVDGDGVQDAAVYALTGGAVLVVTGPGRIAAPPAARTDFYTPPVHSAWTVGEQVYLVFVPGGSEQLKSLLNAVYRQVG
jgi:hypothetical protein